MTVSRTHQFLTFRLGAEVYAIDVASTREVIDFANITPLPKTPEWIRGVVNLRGNVIPVLDLKLRLGIGVTERTKNTCILILELLLEGEPLVLGIVADAVQEVLEIDAAQIAPPPRPTAKASTAYIRGMGRRAEGMLIILDVDRVFGSSQVDLGVDCVEKSEPAAFDGVERRAHQATLE